MGSSEGPILFEAPTSFEGPLLSKSLAEAAGDHYLRLDLKAPDRELLRRWKERVKKRYEDCFKDRLLLHTHRKLVVAVDEPKLLSETVSCSLYIPLKRNQDEVVQKGQQFDLRGMFEEFKREVYGWEDWKPGMEIEVSLVRREQIPSYLLTKANHNELQQASSRCAVEHEVGHAVDIERTIM